MQLAQSKAMPSRRLIVVFLGILMGVNALSIDIYMPAMPIILQDFRSTPKVIQATFSIFLIGTLVGQVLWGPASERYGRKPMVAAGMLVFAAASLVAALTKSIEVFLAARFVQAVGVSSAMVLARAITKDLYDADEAPRIYSSLIQTLGIFTLAAPLLGGIIVWSGNWRLVFHLLTVVGLIMVIVTAFALPESHPPERRTSLHPAALAKGYGLLLGGRRFMLLAVASGGAFGALFAMLTGGSFYFIDLSGWTALEFSILCSAASVLFIGTCQVNIMLLRRHGPWKIGLVALVVQLLASLAVLALLMLGWGQIYVMSLFLVALMAGTGFTLGNSVACSMIAAAERGGAGFGSAVLGVVQFLLSALVVPLSTALPAYHWSIALTICGCSAIAVIGWSLAGNGVKSSEI